MWAIPWFLLFSFSFFLFFFFQAEDGIRDLVRSRGLGDVYKRQIPYSGADDLVVHVLQQHAHAVTYVAELLRRVHPQHGDLPVNGGEKPEKVEDERGPVSYTHLTLPTIYSV